MSDDRTEQPTQRRRQDALRKGRVARTKEAGQAASLVAATLALGWIGSSSLERLGGIMAAGIAQMGALARTPLDQAQITTLAVNAVGTVGLITAPVALTAVVTVVAFHTAQGGWNVATEALKFDLNRLNPATGFKRLGPSSGGMELLRMSVAATMIGILGWNALSVFVEGSAQLARVAPVDAAASMWAVATTLIKQAAIGLMAIAGGDYFFQRYKLTKSLMMTKQEVKDDLKNSEGNPEIKARVRR
ncbi:MAG: EscU/YscU/HrcU family type III secretion system export apparatus switch protein, partial [Vicinamibacterales bacterium]